MKHFLVTISSSICRDGQMIRIFGNVEKYINQDDPADAYESAEETNMGHGDEDCQWCDFSGDFVLEDNKEYNGTAEELIKQVSEEYGISPFFINVYEVSKKYEGNN